jgi:hypothetical protein
MRSWLDIQHNIQLNIRFFSFIRISSLMWIWLDIQHNIQFDIRFVFFYNGKLLNGKLRCEDG